MAGRFHADMTPSEFLAAWLAEDGLPDADREVFRAYYRHYARSFRAHVRRAYDHTLAPVATRLRELPPNGRVLEIGAGCGTEALYFALLGADVTAVDISGTRLGVARRRAEILQREFRKPLACEFILTSLLDFRPPEPFDLIWMEQAFHHLAPRDQAVARIAALLKPGGIVMIAETNPFNLLVQLQLFLQRGLPHVATYRDAQGREHAYGVECILPPATLTRHLRNHGVQRVKLEYHRLLPAALPDWPPLDLLERLAHRLLPLFVKRFVCSQYTYVGALAGSPPQR
jgi:SAM-dependent methyltransferase